MYFCAGQPWKHFKLLQVTFHHDTSASQHLQSSHRVITYSYVAILYTHESNLCIHSYTRFTTVLRVHLFSHMFSDIVAICQVMWFKKAFYIVTVENTNCWFPRMVLKLITHYINHETNYQDKQSDSQKLRLKLHIWHS